VNMGDEHHDGAVLVDVDGDGDLDIISIGWTIARCFFTRIRQLTIGGEQD
jgi:hypothetical protein